jgi:hypothetical protein
MALQLITLHARPNEVAVTKVGGVVTDGAFFLDFSRPLEHIRWFGVRNRWLGLTVGLMVPVVHQGERSGGYVISVHRSDPYFADVRRLWKERYPSKRTPPTMETDGLNIIADFARQFPEDSR